MPAMNYTQSKMPEISGKAKKAIEKMDQKIMACNIFLDFTRADIYRKNFY